MAYLLDSNAFIEAKNFHYRFTFCPAFWAWILREHTSGLVFSIEKVQSELTDGNDDLSVWAAAQTSQFFLPADAAVTAALPTVSAWVMGQSFTPAAVSEFFGCADYWLVGHALAHGHTVVTREVPDPGSKKRVKIPDVCVAVGVAFKNPFQLLEDEGAQFVLQ